MNSGFFQQVKNALLRIVRFVAQQRLNLGNKSRQQSIRALKVMGLSRRQVKACGIAKRIAGRVDFGGQPALTAPDRFLLTDIFGFLAPFLRAPAAC